MPRRRKPSSPALTRRRDWKALFLANLAETGNVKLAADGAKVSRQSAYNHREDNKDFAARWDSAVDEAMDLLEAEARRRAVVGVDDPVIYEGKLCGVWVDDKGRQVSENTPGATLIPLTVKKYSDTLLIFLLKGGRPQKFRDTHHHTHDGRLNIIRTAAEGEVEADSLLGDLRERLGTDDAGA